MQINIRQLSAGSKVTIIGYKTVYGGYIGKLIAKGLTIGTTLTICDTSFSEGEVKVMLKGKIVTLSKPEADTLYVLEINNHKQ